jgi:putative ABC transport system ATP-binding protein
MHALGAGRRERVRRATELLGRIGLATRAHFLPVKCSGGERQRAAVARGLVNEPELLLADEPTGSVDTKTGEGILDLFHDLNRSRGLTVVMITHNEKIAERTSRCVTIVDGRVAGERRGTGAG